MRTTTKETARAGSRRRSHDDIATAALPRTGAPRASFAALRVVPVMTIDPDRGASSFSFRDRAARRGCRRDLERLFELPAQLAAEREEGVASSSTSSRRSSASTRTPPRVMRSIFQTQPRRVACLLRQQARHDAPALQRGNEPFWRSAKQIELGVIPADCSSRSFASSSSDGARGRRRSADERSRDGRASLRDAGARLRPVGGEPRAAYRRTSDLARALARAPVERRALLARLGQRVSLQRLILQALALEPTTSLTAREYRNRHGLPGTSSVARAVEDSSRTSCCATSLPGTTRSRSRSSGVAEASARLARARGLMRISRGSWCRPRRGAMPSRRSCPGPPAWAAYAEPPWLGLERPPDDA